MDSPRRQYESRDTADDLLAQARDDSLRSMGVQRHPGRRVPGRVVALSRLLSAGVAIAYFFVLDVHPLRVAMVIVLPLAAAWFPNTLAAATGRLSITHDVSRMSPPRPLLLLAWMLLLLPIWAIWFRDGFGS